MYLGDFRLAGRIIQVGIDCVEKTGFTLKTLIEKASTDIRTFAIKRTIKKRRRMVLVCAANDEKRYNRKKDER